MTPDKPKTIAEIAKAKPVREDGIGAPPKAPNKPQNLNVLHTLRWNSELDKFCGRMVEVTTSDGEILTGICLGSFSKSLFGSG